jgi:hypothetical protein
MTNLEPVAAQRDYGQITGTAPDGLRVRAGLPGSLLLGAVLGVLIGWPIGDAI